MSDTKNISGISVATWESPYTSGLFDTPLTAGILLGEFESKDDALKAALERTGAEAICQIGDQYTLYSLDGAAKFTRANIEQSTDYPVANVSVTKSQNALPVTLVTEDNYELVPPVLQEDAYSGTHYRFAAKVRLSSLSFLSADDYRAALEQNSTVGVTAENLSPEHIQEKLAPALEILDLYDPHAVDWLRGLTSHDIHLQKSDAFLAMYQPLFQFDTNGIRLGGLYISDDFWTCNDIEKASILYHECIHSRQGPVSMAISWWEAYAQKRDLGENASEDEAYLAQYAMLKYFDISSGGVFRDISFYLKQRNLL